MCVCVCVFNDALYQQENSVYAMDEVARSDKELIGEKCEVIDLLLERRRSESR